MHDEKTGSTLPKTPLRTIRREAADEDLDAVYRLGFDAWGEGMTPMSYLAACRTSTKYRAGRWHVLERDGSVVSALLLHADGFSLPPACFGIGSVATHPAHRRSGHASRLVSEVTAALGRRGVRGVYLFSDIAPRFYARLGYRALDGEGDVADGADGGDGAKVDDRTTCMVHAFRREDADALSATRPDYF